MNIQIKDISGKILFEYDKENNTLKDTMVKAIKEGVSLKCADLYGADLKDADLCGAYLRFADLYDADLRNANLSGVDLKLAELYDADLNGANLYGANLTGTGLTNADLSNTNLSYANLYGANLYSANLSYADLSNANLYGANLYDANLSGTKNIPSIPLVCPSEGSFIGWKKILHYKECYKGEFLVKLLIPEDAKRSSATTSKCRCNKARVLEIRNISDDSTVEVITNINYNRCVYRVGEYVYPDYFDENRWKECSHGIHFFVDRQDAISY